MGKKNQKRKESDTQVKDKSNKDDDSNKKISGKVAAAASKKSNEDDSSSDTSSSSSDEEDELALDGVVVRNPDVSSSEEEDDDDDDEVDGAGDIDSKVSSEKKKPAAATKDSNDNNNNYNNKNNSDKNNKRSVDAITHMKKKKKKKSNNSDDDTLQVEFTFCDMDEKFFHGLKSLLHNSSTVYQQNSSNLSDIMIDNVSVGTVVSTTEQYADDGTVFGFASVINVTTYQESPALQYLKEHICLKYCPKDRKDELITILSGTTRRPAGFLIHGRMLNLPMELVHTLHEQLIQDIDWAINHAEGGIEEQKSLDFGILIRIAPCIQEKKTKIIYYKYFDDEILSGRADFMFPCPAPSSGTNTGNATTTKDKDGENESLSVIVLTKNGHRQAIEDLKQMVT